MTGKRRKRPEVLRTIKAEIVIEPTGPLLPLYPPPTVHTLVYDGWRWYERPVTTWTSTSTQVVVAPATETRA